eukprot:30878-Rhodomonas_salina.3
MTEHASSVPVGKHSSLRNVSTGHRVADSTLQYSSGAVHAVHALPAGPRYPSTQTHAESVPDIGGDCVCSGHVLRTSPEHQEPAGHTGSITPRVSTADAV